MAKKIFISYKSDVEDTRFKNLLVAWAANKDFDFNFNDTSVGVSINSEDATYIKRVIKKQIEDSKIFLYLVGKNTHKSDWCNWEIEKASDANKSFIIVKLNLDYTVDIDLYGQGAKWVYSFNYEKIKEAIDAC